MTDPKVIHTRQEQASETRRKLLQSARRLFAEKGYAGTHVRDINRNIGLADGLMYHYFPGGKEEILHVLLQESVSDIRKDLASRGGLIDVLSIGDALEQIYRNADEMVAKHLDMFKIFFKENKVRELAKLEVMRDYLGKDIRRFPDFLRARAAAGEIREMDYESAADTLSAIMMSHFLKKLADLGPSPLGDPAYRRRLIEYQVSLWKKEN